MTMHGMDTHPYTPIGFEEQRAYARFALLGYRLIATRGRHGDPTWVVRPYIRHSLEYGTAFGAVRGTLNRLGVEF